MSDRRRRLKFWKWMRRKRRILPVQWFLKHSKQYRKWGITSAKGWQKLENDAAFEFIGYEKER